MSEEILRLCAVLLLFIFPLWTALDIHLLRRDIKALKESRIDTNG